MKSIRDFTGHQWIEIGHSRNDDRQIISLKQNRGPISFWFLMTPEQAREMAAALIEAADSFNKEKT